MEILKMKMSKPTLLENPHQEHNLPSREGIVSYKHNKPVLQMNQKAKNSMLQMNQKAKQEI
jgi:hypothetical protein